MRQAVDSRQVPPRPWFLFLFLPSFLSKQQGEFKNTTSHKQQATSKHKSCCRAFCQLPVLSISSSKTTHKNFPEKHPKNQDPGPISHQAKIKNQKIANPGLPVLDGCWVLTALCGV
jgi:hypothetical protein